MAVPGQSFVRVRDVTDPQLQTEVEQNKEIGKPQPAADGGAVLDGFAQRGGVSGLGSQRRERRQGRALRRLRVRLFVGTIIHHAMFATDDTAGFSAWMTIRSSHGGAAPRNASVARCRTAFWSALTAGASTRCGRRADHRRHQERRSSGVRAS